MLTALWDLDEGMLLLWGNIKPFTHPDAQKHKGIDIPQATPELYFCLFSSLETIQITCGSEVFQVFLTLRHLSGTQQEYSNIA